MDGLGLILGEDGIVRCFWCGRDALYRPYHDHEWGRPVAEDRALFAKLCLEVFQAGLSWSLILHRREVLHLAFGGFAPEAVARLTAADVARLLADRRLIRHRGKIEAMIANARAALAIIEREGSLASFLWRFAPAKELPPPRSAGEFLARRCAREAIALANELKHRGFRFFGPTTVYAFMQAMGFVNDHLEGCSVRSDVAMCRARFRAAYPV